MSLHGFSVLFVVAFLQRPGNVLRFCGAVAVLQAPVRLFSSHLSRVDQPAQCVRFLATACGSAAGFSQMMPAIAQCRLQLFH